MATSTHVFNVAGMHCGSCSLLIDDTLEDLPGVTSAHTDIKTGQSTVALDSTQINPKHVADTITDLGYTVTSHR